MRKQVQVSLSIAEQSALDELAREQSLSRSALVRKMIIREAYEAGRRDLLGGAESTDEASEPGLNPIMEVG